MSFEITTDAKSIERRIVYAIAKKLKAKGSDHFTDLANSIHSVLYNAMLESDTYISLTYGTLRADFGLDADMIAQLPNIIKNLIDVTVKWNDAYGKRGRMKNEYEIFNVQVGVIPKFGTKAGSKVIRPAIEAAKYYSNGNLIDWLTWLLFGGVEVVVEDYKVLYKAGRGRSEMGIMAGPNGYFTFEVDPQYAGTINDNWVTRTLEENRLTVYNEIYEFIKKIF